MERFNHKYLRRKWARRRRSSARSIILSLAMLSCAAPCYSGGTEYSLHGAVKKVLSQFGRDSFRINYLFDEKELLHPGNLKDSGWNSTVHKAWVYEPDMDSGCDCHKIEYFKCIDNELSGFVVNSTKRHGETTDFSGMEMETEFGELTFIGPSSYEKIRSGEIVYSEGGGEAETRGAPSLVTRRAIYFDGIRVQPIAETETCDTTIYVDSSGNRLVCTHIVSIAIGLTNNANYFNCSARNQGRCETVHCAAIPAKCRPDTGNMILREINKAIGNYSFTVKNESGLCGDAIFRTRAECESYAGGCSKKK